MQMWLTMFLIKKRLSPKFWMFECPPDISIFSTYLAMNMTWADQRDETFWGSPIILQQSHKNSLNQKQHQYMLDRVVILVVHDLQWPISFFKKGLSFFRVVLGLWGSWEEETTISHIIPANLPLPPPPLQHTAFPIVNIPHQDWCIIITQSP